MYALKVCEFSGTSLVVQWFWTLYFFFFLQRIQVQSLVGELRSCMLCSMAKKLREKKDCEFAELVC